MSKYIIFILGLLFSLPVFISFSSDWLVRFSRFGGESGLYITTLPISLFIATLIIPFYLFTGSSNKNLLKGNFIILICSLLILFLLTCFLFFSYLNAKNIIFLYIIIFYFCSLNLLSKINQANYFNLIIFLFYFQIFFGIASHVIVSNYEKPIPSGTLIPEILVIYNFEQYYSFGSSLCATILITNKKFNLFKKIFFLLVAFYLSKITENATSQLFIIIFFIFISLNSILKINHKNLFTKTPFLIICFLFSILIPFVAWFIFEYFPEYVGNPASHGLWARIIVHHHWIEKIEFHDIFLPLTSTDWFHDFNWEPHHQLYNSLFYGGIFFLAINLFFNIFIIHSSFAENYIPFGLFYFFVGSSVEPLTHPFLFLQFYLLMAASNALRKNNLLSINKSQLTQ